MAASARLVTFHSLMLSSPALPAASVFPSGLNATALTVPVSPVRGCPIAMAWAGSVTFHSRTAPSLLAAARVCPSGLICL